MGMYLAAPIDRLERSRFGSCPKDQEIFVSAPYQATNLVKQAASASVSTHTRFQRVERIENSGTLLRSMSEIRFRGNGLGSPDLFRG
jgi:hypothetical protein